MRTINVCGLSCPEPVVRTICALKTLPEGEKLEVLVDTVTARENLLRTASSMNCEVEIEENGKYFKLMFSKKL